MGFGCQPTHPNIELHGTSHSDPSKSIPFQRPQTVRLKPLRYIATEANGFKNEGNVQHSSSHKPLEFTIRPLSAFKPKPISPDIAFDPQPDAYWDELLFNIPPVDNIKGEIFNYEKGT